MTVDAALLEEVVPEVPVLLSLIITATLVSLHMTIHRDVQGSVTRLHAASKELTG